MEGGEFEIESTDQNHSFSVYYRLSLIVRNENGSPAQNVSVEILNSHDEVVLKTKSDNDGKLSVELPE